MTTRRSPLKYTCGVQVEILFTVVIIGNKQIITVNYVMFACRYVSGAIFTIRGYILKFAAFFKLYIYNLLYGSDK